MLDRAWRRESRQVSCLSAKSARVRPTLRTRRRFFGGRIPVSGPPVRAARGTLRPHAPARARAMAAKLPPPRAGRTPPGDLPFATVVGLLDYLSGRETGRKKALTQEEKRKGINVFVERFADRESGSAYDVFRLLLPHFDTERGNYRLKEAALGKALAATLGLIPADVAAQRVIGWKKPRNGASSGVFPEVVDAYLLASCYSLTPEAESKAKERLRVRDVNERLDALAAAAGDAPAQQAVLRWLWQRTTRSQMYWIVSIIMKSMKVGVGEGTFFAAWHPDAQDVYNSTCSLRKVFNELTDVDAPAEADVAPGKPARPQRAAAALTALALWNRLRAPSKEEAAAAKAAGGGGGGAVRAKAAAEALEAAAAARPPPPFVVETKLDGERIQIHKMGDTVLYYSRRAIEHGEASSYGVLDAAILAATAGHASAILDGELLVWDATPDRDRFLPFGTVKGAVGAVRDRAPRHQKLVPVTYEGKQLAQDDVDFPLPEVRDCQLVFVAFDILYLDGRVLTGRAASGEGAARRAGKAGPPLSERLAILERAVTPATTKLNGTEVCGRVVPLLPGKTEFKPGVLSSREASTLEEIEAAVAAATAVGEEGIVVKRLDSEWRASDRSSAWLKLKPDYYANIETDVVIVGAYYGGGKRRGGELASYLLGLGDEAPPGCERPAGFVTYAKAGAGFTDEQRALMNERLAPLLQEEGGAPPACVRATGLEAPDVWVRDPFKSLVISITGDLRRIPTKNYAAGVTLRFPRITRARPDKAPTDANSRRDVEALLAENRARAEESAARGGGAGGGAGKRAGGRGGPAAKRRKIEVVGALRPSSAAKAVVKESDALAGQEVHVLNYAAPAGASAPALDKAGAEAAVKRLGGVVYQSYVPKVKLLLAGARCGTDPRVEARAAEDRSVLSLEWLAESAAARAAAPRRPRHFLHLGADARGAAGADAHGDPLEVDGAAADVAALLERHVRAEALDAAALAAALAPGGAPGGSAVALARHLDGLLAARGALDWRRAALRGCSLVLLPLPRAAAASASDAALWPATRRVAAAAAAHAAGLRGGRAEQLELRARLAGAAVAAAVDAATTHVVGLTDDDDASLAPAALLAAVRDGAGDAAAVAALEAGLREGRVRVVAHSWLDAALAAADAAPRALALARPAEAEHPLLEAGALEAVGAWPWREFAPAGRPLRASPRRAAAAPLPSTRRGRAVNGARRAAPSATPSLSLAEAVTSESDGAAPPARRRAAAPRARAKAKAKAKPTAPTATAPPELAPAAAPVPAPVSPAPAAPPPPAAPAAPDLSWLEELIS
jgi:DNA ligase-4